MRRILGVGALFLGVIAAASISAGAQRGRAQGPRPPALLEDYIAFSVTRPPEALGLDPFYTQYVDANGIPVASSDKTPKAALLAARDIVNFMLADRPDLRKELIRKRWKVAIMAETEVTRMPGNVYLGRTRGR